MEWMTVRVFSKSLGYFRPVALAITIRIHTIQKPTKRRKGFKALARSLVGTLLAPKAQDGGLDAWSASCIARSSRHCALILRIQSPSAFPAVYHDQHQPPSGSCEEHTQLHPIVLTIKNCPRIDRGSAYRPRNSDRIPCKPR
jgi:hypothetical protein